MSRTLTELDREVARQAQELGEHKGEDQGHFGLLRGDVARLTTAVSDMGSSLGKRIDNMGEDLQNQITSLTLDKAKAEGRAEGVASVKAAIAAPRWWHPIVVVVAGIILTAAIGLTAWLAKTVFSNQQSEIDALRSRPVASVTVSPAQSQPAPIPVSPPDPVTPEPSTP